MLAYDDEGAGPVLLFVHGISADRTRWRPIVDLLRGSFRCVTVDLPGHGGSTDEGCDLLSVGVALQELIDHLGVARPVVVGHSLGGNAALLFAALHPAQGVVAIDAVPLFLPHLAERLAPYRERLLGDGFDAAFQEWEERWFPTDRLPPGTGDAITGSRAPRRDVVLAYWQNVLSPEAAAAVQPGFAAVLGSISVPTLVLLAQEPSPEDAAMLGRIEHGVVEVWQGGGHFLHLVDPARFAERLAAFAVAVTAS